MAGQVIVDSGLVLATVLPETYTDAAQSRLATWIHEGVSLHAPTLFHYELAAVIRKKVYQKQMAVEDADAALSGLLTLTVQLHFDRDLVQRGYELASLYERPTAYDAQYLALAERLGCELWTADKKLFNSLRDKLASVMWIGNAE